MFWTGAGRCAKVICAMFGISAGLVASAHADLEAYWAANGNALDSSGNGNNGVLENGTTYGPGILGEAFTFNGNDDVSIASPSFNLSASDFTISVWANFTAFNFAGAGQLGNTFVGQDVGGGDQNKWVFFYDASTNSEGFHVNSPTLGAHFFEQAVPTPPSTDAWNMYTVTESGGTLAFYFDGAYIGQDTGVTIPTVNSSITLGEAEGIGHWSGNQDETRIYNTALSSNQISGLYAAVPDAPTALPLAMGVLGLLVRRRRKTA
jgi:hypothetical protein